MKIENTGKKTADGRDIISIDNVLWVGKVVRGKNTMVLYNPDDDAKEAKRLALRDNLDTVDYSWVTDGKVMRRMTKAVKKPISGDRVLLVCEYIDHEDTTHRAICQYQMGRAKGDEDPKWALCWNKGSINNLTTADFNKLLDAQIEIGWVEGV